MVTLYLSFPFRKAIINNIYIVQLLRSMKALVKWDQIDQYHAKCICQTCTCHKHRCPKCDIHVPFQQISSYQNDYHKHPINTWQKPPPEKAKPYEPYGNIDSTYKNHYPGHKPHMRQKIVPRVKNEDKNVPFDGDSEYKNKFTGKSVVRDPIKNKDKIYTPSNQPFDGSTTYNDHYIKKDPNTHDKKKKPEYDFPPGYKFDGSTTYNNSYTEKPYEPARSYKPEQSFKPTGDHDLNTIYRKDYDEKKMPEPCPILKMPHYPTKINHPNQHYFYNKHIHNWQQK